MVYGQSKSKKQTQEECIINCLPGELIDQILLKLPVSILLTCTGVCKKWYNCIKDPLFATAHLQHAPRCALFFFPQESVAKKLFPSEAIIFDENWSHSTCTVPIIGPNDYLSGTCNGLVCLYTKTSTIKIANLATGDCLHIEKPAKNLKGDHFSYYTFGFDPDTKEYKVTHFLIDHCDNSRKTFRVIQVYTLGSENWKDVHAPEALSLSSVKTSGVVNVNGAVYWLNEGNGANSKFAVMSFNLGKEIFTQIQVPEAAIGDDSSRRCYRITEIDGQACIATAEVYRRMPRMISGDLQIWAFDNKNVEKKWSHKYSIKHTPNFLPGPHFIYRDKIIMLSGICNLYSYELLGKNLEINKKVRSRVLLDFSPHKPQNVQSFVCVKSLVQLDAYKKVGMMHRPKQRDGWELKRWEVWEDEISNTKNLCNTIHQTELKIAKLAHLMITKINRVQHRLPDEMQRLGAEIIQKLHQGPHTPLQPMSSRRLNWVEHKRILEQLPVRVENLKYKTEAATQAKEKIFSLLETSTPDQGASGSNADKSSVILTT